MSFSSLLNPENKIKFEADIRAEYEMMRQRHLSKQVIKDYLSIEDARKNKLQLDWENYTPQKPAFVGIKVFKDYDLSELRSYIDWTPFFSTWELHGKYPNILEDKIVGVEAKKLLNDANALLDKIIKEKWITANGVIGFFEANSDVDDIELKDISNEETRTDKRKSVLHHLRQQNKKGEGLPNYCLSDFIAPKESGKQDYVGGFAVTTGIGIEKWIKHFQDTFDDYNKIMLASLADRLAEAFAERMHERVRKEFWKYDTTENLSNEELIKEKYNGIRPAPGYPACPDHTEKPMLFKLLNAEENTGITLTENNAMYPASSVSGWYFSHPDSKYFGIGKIAKDQVEDYAKRKNMKVEDMERWLHSVLNYDA